jgi:hypothetical protein
VPASKTNSGTVVDASSYVEDRDGNLLCKMSKMGPWTIYFFGNWEDWRVKYCFAHRKDKLMRDFRLGKINLKTLIYSFYLRRKDAAHKKGK